MASWARPRGGGTVAIPLASASGHWWVDVPPSSGFSEGPFVARPLLQGPDQRRLDEIEHAPMEARVLPARRIGGGAALETEASSARRW
jgi:hypothetical protein